MEAAIDVGTRWTYKGKNYTVIGGTDVTRMKDADSGNWHRGVVYKSDDDPDAEGLAFVRSAADFRAKFEPIKEGGAAA